MSFGRPARFIKTEVLITIGILVSAMLFSFEPTRQFFIESVIEQQYTDLETFKKMALYMKEKHVRIKDLKYVVRVIEGLEDRNPNFILKEDSELLMAKAYEKLGEKRKSIEILKQLLNNANDVLSKIDAMLQLAAIYYNENQLYKALLLIETNQNLHPFYKKSEQNFLLARLYYQTGKIKSSGKVILNTGNLDLDEQYFYKKVVLANWKYYSMDEKKGILENLSKMKMYKVYSECASEFIGEYNPDYKEVEQLALDIVYNCHSAYVKDFISKLKVKEDYLPIYYEMLDLYSLSKTSIRSQSGEVRGSYYYKLLKPLVRKARYNDKKASNYYQNYLKGDLDMVYVRKNLQIAIRNFIAFKRYEEITNAVEKSYELLSLNTNSGMISENISFWNGYSYFMLGDKDRALINFEAAISRIPDGYYAIHARDYIHLILEEKQISEREYVKKFENGFNNASDIQEKLYYGRLLFAFKNGLEKESIKNRVVYLLKKYNNNAIFEFDDSILKRIKNNPNYAKFVAHTRYGLIEKAKAILSSSDITDPDIQNIMILNELVKNKDFKPAWQIFIELGESEFINENFAFLPRDLQMLFYPTPYDSEINLAVNQLENNCLDKYLVYSIIRGESMFITQARSRAGARGLMQLMPSTARLISGKILGKKNVNLYNPLNNIILGTVFLNQSIVSYGFITAIASYNGGIRVIDITKKKFFPENELELMELVPYNETREYIKKILSNYYRYKSIYQGEVYSARMH